jgi:ubiquinone/menaquinone biosynthesis C-methylase UbiE
MDVFFAAEKVGPNGEVIGIDMTVEQLQKSRSLNEGAGYDRVHFRESYIEDLPIVSDSVDVVISNGVINLSSDKKQVFLEAARVLKPGGRLVLSDIVTTQPLPENITCNADLWAACIGGAITQVDYLKMIESAGMKVIDIKKNPYAFISNNAKGATQQYGIKSISILAINK